LQGEQYTEVAKALRDGDLDRAPITPAERLLLEFVGTLTRHAYRITDEQVQALRDVGWTDEQIAEAVYEGALFNLLVRLNRTTEDWHTNAVTLSVTKGLGMRFFATLRMTRPSGHIVKCTNVMWSDLADAFDIHPLAIMEPDGVPAVITRD
jgi:hypothetical protein